MELTEIVEVERRLGQQEHVQVRVPDRLAEGDLDGAHVTDGSELLAESLPVPARDESGPGCRDSVPDALERHPRVVRHRQRHEDRAAVGGQVAGDASGQASAPASGPPRRVERGMLRVLGEGDGGLLPNSSWPSGAIQ